MKLATYVYTTLLNIVLVFLVLPLGAQTVHDPEELAPPPWQAYPYRHFSTYPTLEQEINVDSYLVLDLSAGYVLSASKPNLSHGIASLTKLMTLYIVIQDLKLRRYSLEDSFEITDADIFSSLPYDASRMGLALGQKPSVDELLMGLLVLSGNDAAILLSHISRGSEEVFVQEMNAQAKNLSLNNTYFFDASGLSPFNKSSAEDLAKLSYVLLSDNYMDITTYTAITEMTWNAYTKKSSNLLLGTYSDIDGLKTGYTSEAGFNFIASASRSLFNDKVQRRIIAIVLGAEGDTILEGLQNRKEFARELLDFAYDNFDYMKIEYRPIETRIYGGRKNEMYLISTTVYTLIPKAWKQSIQIDTHIPEYLWAPIDTQTTYGYVDFDYIHSDEKARMAHLRIKSMEKVEKSNIFKRIFDYIRVFFESLKK